MFISGLASLAYPIEMPKMVMLPSRIPKHIEPMANISSNKSLLILALYALIIYLFPGKRGPTRYFGSFFTIGFACFFSFLILF